MAALLSAVGFARLLVRSSCWWLYGAKTENAALFVVAHCLQKKKEAESESSDSSGEESGSDEESRYMTSPMLQLHDGCIQ